MQILFGLLIVVVGIYVSVILNSWLSVNGLFEKSFFQANIADTLNPIITIILTLVVTYYINIKFTNNSKIYELFLELFNEYKKILDEAERTFYEYLELKQNIYSSTITPSKTDSNKLKKYEKELKLNFKKLSMNLDTIFKINNETDQKIDIDENNFKSNLRSLKSHITNDPFGQKSIFNQSSLIQINNIFISIKKDIFLQKVKFYK